MQKQDSYYESLWVEYEAMIDAREKKLIAVEKAEAAIDEQKEGSQEYFDLISNAAQMNRLFKAYDATFKVREAEILADLRSVGQAMEGV